MADLKGKAGIVTGGSSGIGFQIANVLAEAGATVYVISRTGRPKEGVGESASGVVHLKGDVGDVEAMKAMVAELAAKHNGCLDFLVNNAGVSYKCRAENFPMEQFDNIMNVNVKYLFEMSVVCYPYLKKSADKGRIINITSMSAHLGFSEVVPYCTSKGAVLAMTRALAVEWAGDNITVNSIAPGWFRSKMNEQVVDAAHKYGRKVVFVGRSMVRNMSIAADLGYLHIPEGTVVDLKQANDIQDDKLVFMCTGSQGEPMAALGRIADGNHRDIHINEFDTVILASSLIPGNEHGVYKVINKLVQLGAKVVNRDNAAVHVSGHCNEGELLYMYNIVKPKCAMPIHGENRHLVANGLIAVKTGVDPQNVVLAEDGDVVDLYHGKAAVVGSVPCGYVYVDGDSVGELTDDELEKRRILGTEGFVSAFVVVDTDNHEVVTGPKIYLNAVAEDESEFDKVRHQIVEQLNDQMMQGTRDTYKLQQTMRRTLGCAPAAPQADDRARRGRHRPGRRNRRNQVVRIIQGRP